MAMPTAHDRRLTRVSAVWTPFSPSHDEDEKGTSIVGTPSGEQEMLVATELARPRQSREGSFTGAPAEVSPPARG